MSFTPKFVDLVKNSTTVQGTGAVVLGAAPTGFTGFAEACGTGDQFYYCIQGTDKPAEREVGKGTMQADGSIQREPLAGQALTKFTAGAKTIALVAAAEWYAQVGAAAAQPASGSVNAVQSRAALAAIASPADGDMRFLGEGERKGWFRFAAGDQSARVSADPRQGLAVAPANSPGGSAGAWLRQVEGDVLVDWFGALGDDTTDDGPAFAAAVSAMSALSLSYSDSAYKGSAKLRIGARPYFLGTTTININHTLVLEGAGTGLDGGVPTRLRWSAGTTGIRVQRYNTSGAAATDATTHRGGDGSIIRGLFLMGAYSGTEAEAHGIQLRARATVEDVYAYLFEGDGIYINASTGGSLNEGNANCFVLNRVSANNCRDGVYCKGADTNAGIGTMVNVLGCRRWGVNDSSFLGNVWTGCHASDNGIVPAPMPTMCSLGGKRYSVRDGHEVEASTTSPTGTTDDNNCWLYALEGGPASNAPAWTSGMTVRSGGPYLIGSGAATGGLFGCYAESGQGATQVEGNSLIVGGTLASRVRGPRLSASLGWVTASDLSCGRLLNSGLSNLGDTLVLDGYGSSKTMIQQKVSATHRGSLYFNSFGYGMEAYDLSLGYQPVAQLGSNLLFVYNGTDVVVDMDGGGIKLSAGKTLKVGGKQVVAAQQAAIPDHASDTTVNAILGALRAHGLVATA